MKNFFLVTIFLLIFSCTNIEVSEINKNEIKEKISLIQNEILREASMNEKDKIKERMANTLKNNIIFKELSKYNFDNFLIVFSEEIEIINIDKAKSIMLINFDVNTYYFEVIWKKVNNDWKIYDVNAIN